MRSSREDAITLDGSTPIGMLKANGIKGPLSTPWPLIEFARNREMVCAEPPDNEIAASERSFCNASETNFQMEVISSTPILSDPVPFTLRCTPCHCFAIQSKDVLG